MSWPQVYLAVAWSQHYDDDSWQIKSSAFPMYVFMGFLFETDVTMVCSHGYQINNLKIPTIQLKHISQDTAILIGYESSSFI